MKSPQAIATRMQRQWQRKQPRLEMLTSGDAWPREYAIGLPSANDLARHPNAIREHVDRWQAVSVGEVVWRSVNFRASSEPIRVPSHWILQRPSDWVRAAADRQVTADFRLLEFLSGHAVPALRNALITNLKLLQGRSHEELQEVLALAAKLQPGEAQGRPLRSLAGHGVDTKFFERNRQLLIRLLDSRFDGEASEQGLHGFLDALPDGEHWLLVVPLQRGVLPFDIQQVRAHELALLAPQAIRANRILLVENRQCRHLLPELDDTVAILGSGLDLNWLRAEWLNEKEIAYWGDIDTWGLAMLAAARTHRPHLTALMMNRETFDRFAADNAVAERVGAGDDVPEALEPGEQALYGYLLGCERGRLEQEYLSPELVLDAVTAWGTTG